MAVYVAGWDPTEMVCEAAPPSLQLVKTYCDWLVAEIVPDPLKERPIPDAPMVPVPVRLKAPALPL